MRWGPQQLTKCQKEWHMGRALKYGHGWLTSVGGGWTKEKDIYNSRDLPKGRGIKRRREAPGKGEELGTHILGQGVLSSWDVGSSDSVFLAPIWSSCLLPNQLSPHPSPTFGPTLYKFIVMGSLGLDPVRHWARSENRDSTIGAVCGKGCSGDDECNDLLRQDQVP